MIVQSSERSAAPITRSPSARLVVLIVEPSKEAVEAIARELLQAGVDSSVIALWLGHESVVTTQRYSHAHMALKEAALAKTTPLDVKPARFRAGDRLLQFLSAL